MALKPKTLPTSEVNTLTTEPSSNRSRERAGFCLGSDTELSRRLLDDQVDVVDVLVREGAQIQKEQPIITLESDKATMDLPSPVEGVVLKLSVQIGDKVGEGDVISVVDISKNNDWTSVRFWDYPSESYGSVYRGSGFIYQK